MTNNARDLHTQCDKISLYSQWAGLHVNNAKCAVTGILHHRAWADRGLNGPTCERTLKAALHAKVKISGRPVPYLPPTEPYKYLGVHVTLTLNWSTQMAHVCKGVRDKGDLLQGSLASPDQCIRIVQSCIQPVVAYSFSTMAYTPRRYKTIGRDDSAHSPPLLRPACKFSHTCRATTGGTLWPGSRIPAPDLRAHRNPRADTCPER